MSCLRTNASALFCIAVELEKLEPPLKAEILALFSKGFHVSLSADRQRGCGFVAAAYFFGDGTANTASPERA